MDNLMKELNKLWKYYLMLEEDFLSIEQYVAFEDENLNTYSNQFLKLFQVICSEIDAVLKKFCSFYDFETKKKIL